MHNPYAVLEVAETASDAVIKKAYLQKVRAHPPERDPQQFQMIRAAFESIRSRQDRLHYRWFEQTAPNIDELVSNALTADHNTTRPALQLIQQVLAESLNVRRR